MKARYFFAREDYNSLPPFLQSKIDRLGKKLDTALKAKQELGIELFSRKYLEIIRALLFLILENTEHFQSKMIESIGEILAIEDIGLSHEYEAAVKDLIDAEVAEDRQFLIESVLDKIAEVLEE